MLYYHQGSPETDLQPDEIREALFSVLEKLGRQKKVLAVPPDYSRRHSQAGLISRIIYQFYGEKLKEILPAVGTHAPMTSEEITDMYPELPEELFRYHNWRKDPVKLGEVPAEFIEEISEGALKYSWPVLVNRLLTEPDYDLVFSIGQVVPHEVSGMANYNKNIFVGTGGVDSINKSHYLGAVCGMEQAMGRIDTPVRRMLNYASEKIASGIPLIYVLTVIGADERDKLVTRGLFMGDDEECFRRAAQLSQRVNIRIMENPLRKIVVYLDPHEFKSTWLGNKSIYRTRMTLADDGELIVLAPGVRMFGEDREIDRLIRKYGYRTTPEILHQVEQSPELQENLAVAAHLIHGSSENRFHITYCPGHLSADEIREVGFNFKELDEMMQKYSPEKLRQGFNTMPDGEEIFFISNPGLGLWTTKEKFNE